MPEPEKVDITVVWKGSQSKPTLHCLPISTRSGLGWDKRNAKGTKCKMAFTPRVMLLPPMHSPMSASLNLHPDCLSCLILSLALYFRLKRKLQKATSGAEKPGKKSTAWSASDCTMQLAQKELEQNTGTTQPGAKTGHVLLGCYLLCFIPSHPGELWSCCSNSFHLWSVLLETSSITKQ